MTIETALTCERDNCAAEAHEFTLADALTGNEVPPRFVLCDEHAFECGFCYLCGGFFGGIESFEFVMPSLGYRGLCDECVDQLKDSCGELGDDEDTDERYDPADDY